MDNKTAHSSADSVRAEKDAASSSSGGGAGEAGASKSANPGRRGKRSKEFAHSVLGAVKRLSGAGMKRIALQGGVSRITVSGIDMGKNTVAWWAQTYLVRLRHQLEKRHGNKVEWKDVIALIQSSCPTLNSLLVSNPAYYKRLEKERQKSAKLQRLRRGGPSRYYDEEQHFSRYADDGGDGFDGFDGADNGTNERSSHRSSASSHSRR